MAPAQVFHDAEDERKPDLAVKSIGGAVNGDSVEMKDVLGLVCANNCEDSAFHGEVSDGQKKGDDTADLEIDVLDCAGDVAAELVAMEDPNATEQSSSFGNTFSGSDNEMKSNESDVEVDSRFGAMNGDLHGGDRFDMPFKNKKVTAHWRKFISPIMWRCHWLELRMKELHSQALKYDKELAAYKYEKELKSKMVELDNSVSRSVPLIFQGHRKQVMKRRKRKRNEETVDISSYMSNHNLFSYYENRRAETDGHSVDDDFGDLDENNKGTDKNEWLLGFKGSDSSLEQILLNIEALQSRILKLKTQINEVICKNTGEISSSPRNFILGDPPPSYAQSLTGSPGNLGDAVPVGALNSPPHHASEYEMEDMVMPESAVSSYGDAADVDIIESTMGLLSAADVSLDQHQIRELCKENSDDVLINNNQVVEEEYQNFERVSHVKATLQDMVKEDAESSSQEESATPKVSISGPIPGERVETPQETLPKPSYAGRRRGRKPKRKRRGGSVAGSGSWKSERLQKRRLSARKNL